MTPARRMALIAAAVVVAVVAFIALKPSDSSKKQSSTPTTAANGTKTTGQKPAPPPIPTIVVKNGKPVGGIKQLTFNKGDQIKFTVKSDVSDEVHVHGYDLMKDVAPGKPVTFSFKGNIDGEFEAELEGRKEQIIALTVNP
jgi:heme/copper-type cytochrome/quinol oxidase subunit 2